MHVDSSSTVSHVTRGWFWQFVKVGRDHTIVKAARTYAHFKMMTARPLRIGSPSGITEANEPVARRLSCVRVMCCQPTWRSCAASLVTWWACRHLIARLAVEKIPARDIQLTVPCHRAAGPTIASSVVSVVLKSISMQLKRVLILN